MKKRRLILLFFLIACMISTYAVFPCFAADSSTTATGINNMEATEEQNPETDTDTEADTEKDQATNDSDTSVTQSSSGSSSETQPSTPEESSSKETSDTTSSDETECDPLLKRIREDFISSSSTNSRMRRAARYAKNARFVVDLGIDVSDYQGTIDWKKVRASGVKFVYVRIGYSGTTKGNHYVDSYGVSNIRGAQAAGLKVGAYYLSQCTTNEEAASEAHYAVTLLKNNNVSLDLPLIMDYEYVDGCRMYSAPHMTRSDMTSYVMTFCKTVTNAGYDAGLYANPTMLSSKLNGAAIADSYYVWLANWINYDYKTMPSYSNAYDYWQYSDRGTVNGISGLVDMDAMVSSRRTMSSVFDANYYLSHNADIRNALGTDADAAFDHFLRCGMTEGRQASSSFNVFAYANRYHDLVNAYTTNLKSYYVHFVKWGQAEGRSGLPFTASADQVKNTRLLYSKADPHYGGLDYSPVFDAEYYLNRYSDLRNCYGQDQQAAFEHFIKWGMGEGRQASNSFNVFAYANRYLDLQRAYKNDLPAYYRHYIKWGKAEGRNASSYSGSASQKKNTTLLFHWADTSYNGLDYSPVFNGYYYLNKYADLKAAYGDDQQKAFTHFLKWGMKEGRQACPSFNVRAYRARYADLDRAYGRNLAAYYLHYLKWGISEGRSGTLS